MNSRYISVYCNSSNSNTGRYNVQTNAIIQVNAPAVSLASDWAITHIAVSDSGNLEAIALYKDLVDYLPYEES